MEAGDGATRSTRRAASEARSRVRATTIENSTTSNPFTTLAGQAGQTDDSDGDNGNDLTEGHVAFQAAPDAPRPKRFIAVPTPKQKTDTIVLASEEEDLSGHPPRRTRKPSAKAKQNQADQDVRGTRRLDGRGGVEEQAVPESIQGQMNEQTGILRTLLKEWMKQDAHNKKWKQNLLTWKRNWKPSKENAKQSKKNCTRPSNKWRTALRPSCQETAVLIRPMRKSHAPHRPASRAMCRRSRPLTPPRPVLPTRCIAPSTPPGSKLKQVTKSQRERFG